MIDSRAGEARFVLTLAGVIVLIAGLRAAASLIVPFLLSLFLALVTLPLLQWLQRQGLPLALAVIGAVAINLLVLAGMLLLVAGSFSDFTIAAPRYQARLAEMSQTALGWLRAQGIDTSRLVPREVLQPGWVLELVGTLLSSIAAVLSNTVFVLLTMVFILIEAVGLPAKLQLAVGERPEQLQQFEHVKSQVQRYLGIKTVVSLATGITAGTALWVIGVDFPILWGLLAFILNYVPTLGSILAAIPPILLSLVQMGPGPALAVAIVYLVINMVLANIVEPALLGRRLGLSTLVVFLSLVFWGWVWGPVGMLLSVPLTMIVKIMLENSEEFRWLALLLEPSRPAGAGPDAAAPGERRQ